LPPACAEPVFVRRKPVYSGARFNFSLFKEHIHYAQRIMDDIIDLELEKIDAIIGKINADPEEEEIKAVEKNFGKILN
jgi:ribonucleoside-diphosphate reductase alpha chain